jgi:hypothetical protein
MDSKETEKRIIELEKKVSVLRDVEDIKKLQRTYGFYLEHWLYEEIIDCFSDSPDTELNIMVGIYRGKEGIRRYFTGEAARSANPEVLHMIMQLSGVVDIEPDGNSAHGRWYGFGAIALPTGKGVMQDFTGGIYTVEYIKENGKWKIHKIMWNPTFNAPPALGWVKPERVDDIPPEGLPPAPRADKPREIETRYPSGYIPPFHYPHPVTGKKSTEKKHNTALKIKRIK